MLSKSKTLQHTYRFMVPAPLLSVQVESCELQAIVIFTQGPDDATRRLKQFDESIQSKITSTATTPPKSVVGIGGKGAQLFSLMLWGLLKPYHIIKLRSPTTRKRKLSSLWYFGLPVASQPQA